MEQHDIDKTAFVTRQGLFQFTVMPFGLCNASTKFERLMKLVLNDLNWKVCLLYLEYIIVSCRCTGSSSMLETAKFAVCKQPTHAVKAGLKTPAGLSSLPRPR